MKRFLLFLTVTGLNWLETPLLRADLTAAHHTHLVSATTRRYGQDGPGYEYNFQFNTGPQEITISTNVSFGPGVSASVQASTIVTPQHLAGSGQCAVSPYQFEDYGSAFSAVLLVYDFIISVPSPYTVTLEASAAGQAGIQAATSFSIDGGNGFPLLQAGPNFEQNRIIRSGTLQPGRYIISCQTECLSQRPLVEGGQTTASFDLQILDQLPELKIGNITRTGGGGVKMEWEGPEGSRYQPQWSATLESGSWQDIAGTFAFENGKFSFVEDSSGPANLDAMRFYRVAILP